MSFNSQWIIFKSTPINQMSLVRINYVTEYGLSSMDQSGDYDRPKTLHHF